MSELGPSESASSGFGWTSQNSPAKGNTHYLDVRFADGQKGWIAGGSGTLLRTVDGGANWFALESRTDRLLYGVAFADTLQGWVAGAGGTILSTITGGGEPPRPADEAATRPHGDDAEAVTEAVARGARG